MMMKIDNGRLRPATEAEELSSTATMPQAFATHLANQHGLARRFAPVDAYYVDAVAETSTRIRVVEIRGSGCEWIGPAAYVYTDDNRLLPSLYVFPVARHLKPRLAPITDDYGTCQQWVAPLRSRCLRPWA